MTSLHLSVALSFILFGLQMVQGWKILLLPFNTAPHVKMMALTGSHFLKRGHQIWMLTSLSLPPYDETGGSINLIHIDLPATHGPISNLSCAGQERQSYQASHHELNRVCVDQCRIILDSTKTVSALSEIGFDFAILDGIHIFRCIHILPCYLGIPFFTLSIQHSPWIAGVPSLPSVEPHQLTGFSNSMAFHQRFLNTVVSLASYFYFPYLRKEESILFNKYCPRASGGEDIESLVSDAALWFIISQSTCLDYPRNKAPHYIEINIPRPFYGHRMPKELDAFVNTAPNGVILVSYSCFTSKGMLPEEILITFLKTFAGLPQRFVLKYDHKDQLNESTIPDNVFVMDWLPQEELLAHKNTQLLIAHGGAISTNEAVYHGVPVISIPFLADQSYNARRAAEHGWGLTLDKDNINTQTLQEAISKILYDSSYRSSAVLCKHVLQSVPPGEETVLFWVEHVMIHGWKHLRPSSGRQSIAVLLMFDVVAAVLLIILSILYLNYRLLHWFARVWLLAKRKYPHVTLWIGPSLTFLFLTSTVHSIAMHAYFNA